MKKMETIHNALTGEIQEREYTKEQIAEDAAKALLLQSIIDDQTAQEIRKQQVLEKLGLTAEEAALLLG